MTKVIKLQVEGMSILKSTLIVLLKLKCSCSVLASHFEL